MVNKPLIRMVPSETTRLVNEFTISFFLGFLIGTYRLECKTTQLEYMDVIWGLVRGFDEMRIPKTLRSLLNRMSWNVTRCGLMVFMSSAKESSIFSTSDLIFWCVWSATIITTKNLPFRYPKVAFPKGNRTPYFWEKSMLVKNHISILIWPDVFVAPIFYTNFRLIFQAHTHKTCFFFSTPFWHDVTCWSISVNPIIF